MQANEPSTSECMQCGKPKREGNSGTLTGWIFDSNNCRCDLSLLQSISQVSTKPILCLSCNKIIANRKKATITQWIFRPELCRCGSLVAGSLEEQSPPSDSVQSDLQAQVLVPKRYRLIRLIGRGGAAAVYEADDELLKRKVAIKILENLALEAEDLVRFQTEAKITSSLDHPNIVRVLDFGVNEKNTPFMVLEFVNGRTLRTLLKAQGKLSNDQAFDLFSAVAAALSYAYKHNINHRDLKPENLIIQSGLTSDMVPTLIDFGLAKYLPADKVITRGGITLVGTPAYMSPDQAKNNHFDERSEIYSFGCVLFEALVGEPPFSADTALNLLAKHCNEKPASAAKKNAAVDPVLSAVVEKCLQKSPEDRYQSFDEITEALNVSPESEQETLTSQPAPANGSKSPAAIAVACLTVLLSVALLVFIFSKSNLGTANNTNKTVASPMKYSPVSVLSVMNAAEEPLVSYSAKEKKLMLQGDFSSVKQYEEILRYPDAQKLDIGYKQHIDPDGIRFIAKLPLRSVILEKSDSDDRVSRILAGIPTIENLNLKGTNISDKSLVELAKLPRLKALKIDSCKITDVGLIALSRAPKLNQLSINGIKQVSSVALNEFRKLKLEQLSMSDIRLRDQTIRALAKTNVKKLVLGNCLLTDRSIKLLNNRFVVTLDIKFNNIGMEGLRAVMRLPSLRTVAVSKTAEFNLENMQKLRQENPLCEIMFH